MRMVRMTSAANFAALGAMALFGVGLETGA
jgi:hypothetical protein